jgi:hypothetical protein
MAHEGGLQLSVESLNEAIGGRMPCSRPGQGGSGEVSQSLEEKVLELPAQVSYDLLGAAETSKPN